MVVSGSFFVSARAEAVTVSVTDNLVVVQMNLSIHENLTSLPAINAIVNPSNSTSTILQLISPINTTIRNTVPGAKLSNIAMTVGTKNNTGMYTLNENYSMTISGANRNSGSSITSNLSFLSMNVTGPLQINGLELNFVGPAWILPALQEQAAKYSNIKFFIDGSNPSTITIPAQTTKEFSLLNFAWVPPVDQWTQSQNILGKNTSWQYSPQNILYNLTLALPSPEGIFTNVWTVVYNAAINMTIPANAYANGNTVTFDTTTPAETIMPVIIIASLVLAVSAAILDRRIARPIRIKKKR